MSEKSKAQVVVERLLARADQADLTAHSKFCRDPSIPVRDYSFDGVDMREAADLITLQATTIAEQAGEIERRVWRLIDDAPADTDLLLGWWQEWPSRKWQTQVGFAHSTKGGWWHGQATHWMHLPEPAALLSELGERGE